MLMQLHIENVAVIEKTTIDFFDGFNVLTGETGAGKSIIIDSINAVIGEKTSKDIIRTGANKAKITAIFNNIGIDAENIVSDLGITISDDGVLMLDRELSSDGRSVFRVNGNVVPMMIVKQIAPSLINIHGQHDNQQLFNPSKHISVIDAFGRLENEVSEYKEIYSKLSALKSELDSIETNDELKERKIELLTFQIDEIESADLSLSEEDELLSRRDVIRNSEQLSENIFIANSLLSGDVNSSGIIDLSKQFSNVISEIAEYDSDFENIQNRVESISFELEEFLTEIRNAEGKFDFNPKELDEIEERLDVIFRLKKKYGTTIEDILSKLALLKDELEKITFSDKHLEQVKKEYDETKIIAQKKAEEISQKRSKAGENLCECIKEQLIMLDMPNVSFSVSQNTVSLKSDGIDQIEFLISANSGESLRPLSKIASGGELSRIMLAIKTVLSDIDFTNAMIFDEIDTGVSGKTARKIGKKMKEIAKEKQVLCVTHLAQIASLADTHFYIEKKTQDMRTYTSVKMLDYTDRVSEIARIMGGDIITEVTLSAAKELINERE